MRAQDRLTLAVGTLILVAGCTGPAAPATPSPAATPAPATPAPATPAPATATATAPPAATATPTQEPSAIATQSTAEQIPETSLVGGMDIGYKLRITGRDPFSAEQEQFTPEELPLPPGEPLASWFQWDGHYVALIIAQGLTSEPICPGASFQQTGATQFSHVTNAPADSGGCDLYPFPESQVAPPPVLARRCGPGLILYRSSIPVDSEAGNLWVAIEQYDGDLILGVTGSVPAGEGEPPELNPAAAAYEFAEGTFLEGILEPGETVVVC